MILSLILCAGASVSGDRSQQNKLNEVRPSSGAFVAVLLAVLAGCLSSVLNVGFASGAPLAYNLFTQKPKQELTDFQNWTKMTKPGEGDDLFRVNGAGEMLVFSAADFEDFLVARPDMPAVMESELKAVIRHLVENRWPSVCIALTTKRFLVHSTYTRR